MSAWTDLRVPAERELVVGFYDLTGYTAYCESASAATALDLITRHTTLASDIITDAGGWFVKAIGDRGLFIFMPEQADAAVAAMQRLRTVGDPWLTGVGYRGRVCAVLHAGPVALGRIGPRGREQPTCSARP
jgi:class 3 adenylate cyclase